MAALPNFFLAGAAKAGTTSLYHYLDQHPEIYLSPIKEPCYFASEIRPENFADHLQAGIAGSIRDVQKFLSGPMTEKRFSGLVSEWDDYCRLFQCVNGQKAIGDASVCYLWSKTAARNIAEKIPGAKIVMILRDPADRAWSQYQDSLSGGWPLKSFREEVQASMRRTSGKFDVTHPFLEHGSYHDQVQRYLDCFPKEQIRIYWYEDYRGQISSLLPDVLKFLHVDPSFTPDSTVRHRVPRAYRFGFLQPLKKMVPRGLRPLAQRLASKPTGSVPAEDRALLVDYYRKDILKLSKLLDRELATWLRVD